MKRYLPYLIQLAKFAFPAAVLAYLIYTARQEAIQQNFNLAEQPKHWGYLTAAWAFFLTAITVTMVRWYFLVRALGLRFRLRDAFRLGFLGYMFNFVSLGSVGGDAFKAVFIAREQHGRRTEAVASVLVDRVIGLYGLFLVATFSVVYFRLWNSEVEEIRVFAKSTLILTGVGAIGILLLLVPGFTTGALSEMISGLPRVGPLFKKLIGAVRMYRRRPGVLVVAGVISLGVHTCATLGIYCICRGLLPGKADLGAHFIIVPPAMLAGAMPLPLMGLGAFEGALELMYKTVPVGIPIDTLSVLLIAFAYRIITILNAGIGAIVWLSSRRDLADVIEEAEHPAEESTASGQQAV